MDKRVKLRELQEIAFEEYHRLDSEQYIQPVVSAEDQYEVLIQPVYSRPPGMETLPIRKRIDHITPLISENLHIGDRKHVCGIHHQSLWGCFLDNDHDASKCRDYAHYFSKCMEIARDNVINHGKAWHYD